MLDGLTWNAIGVIAAIGLPIVAAILGMLFRIDRRIGKLWAMLDLNAIEHRQIKGRLRRQAKRLDGHDKKFDAYGRRIVKLEEQVGE